MRMILLPFAGASGGTWALNLPDGTKVAAWRNISGSCRLFCVLANTGSSCALRKCGTASCGRMLNDSEEHSESAKDMLWRRFGRRRHSCRLRLGCDVSAKHFTPARFQSGSQRHD
jgi:hypothetical protein